MWTMRSLRRYDSRRIAPLPPPPSAHHTFCADTSGTWSIDGAQSTYRGTLGGSTILRFGDMLIDIEDQAGGDESVVSANAPFSLDAHSWKDNASPRQNDMEVKRALVDALDVSWGTVGRNLDGQSPKNATGSKIGGNGRRVGQKAPWGAVGDREIYRRSFYALLGNTPPPNQRLGGKRPFLYREGTWYHVRRI